MPSFENDIATGFHRWQAILLLALQVLGFLIWRFQNSRPGRLGGAISLVKAYWLTYAIILWLVVPALLAPEHSIMAALAGSVALRALVEAPLCLRQKWKVGYGMTHNIIHLALCAAAIILLTKDERPSLFITLLVALTILSVLTEILFVSWFRKATHGPESGIYFVPGGDQFKKVNRATAWLFLPQYAIFISVLALNTIGRSTN